MTKNVVSTSIIVFMVMAMASVTIVLPVSALTVSAELLKAWPKWPRLNLPQHPNQIFYLLVRNNGTEPVYIKITFSVYSPIFGTVLFSTDTAFLPPHPPPIKLEAIFTPPGSSEYYVSASLYYSADGFDWLIDGTKRFDFIAVA